MPQEKVMKVIFGFIKVASWHRELLKIFYEDNIQ